MVEPVRVGIASLGSYLPEDIITNEFWEKRLNTSDQWITERTGIKRRHWVAGKVTNSEMVANVAMQCLNDAGLTPADIDILINGTITGDRPLPSNACLVQARIGATNAACFDVSAACSGFIYSTHLARALIISGLARNVLAIGSEVLTSIGNWNDRSTIVLFGDACGGVLLQPWKEGMPEVLATDLGSDGTDAEYLTIRAGGMALPLTPELLDQQAHKIYMAGSAIFKRAIRAMTETTTNALAKCGLTNKDLTWLVPHQANLRILHSTARNLGIPNDRVFINVENIGNTSAASVPVALHDAASQGLFKKGDIIGMCAFGGGLTWGSIIVRW